MKRRHYPCFASSIHAVQLDQLRELAALVRVVQGGGAGDLISDSKQLESVKINLY